MARRNGPRNEAQAAVARAPYRFVPVSRKVYFPAWGELAQLPLHDAPFEDGISGTITLRIRAHSPLLVAREGRSGTPRDFCRYGDRLAVPGSSIRGLLRSVVEVASFGKLGSFTHDQHLSVRDLHNGHVYRRFVTRSTARGYQATAEAGFLERDAKGGWWIRPCRHARAPIVDLEAFAQKRGKRVNLGGRSQRACQKYEQWGTAPEDLTLRFDTRRPDKPGLDYDLAVNLGTGALEGQLVLTGQPTPTHVRRAKKREFVFYAPSSELLEVSDALRRSFEEVHSEGRERHGLPTPNEDWRLLRTWLEVPRPGRGVPVFFLREPGNASALWCFGLAQLPRIPYRLTVHAALQNTSPHHLDRTRPDLAELIFGKVPERRSQRGDGERPTGALRGRVSFEPFWLEGRPQTLPPVKTVLSGPRASFYPHYVQQPEARDGAVPLAPLEGDARPKPHYKTLMDRDAELAGWKRYPVRDGQRTPPPPPSKASEKTITRLEPLAPGAELVGRVHVHNLKPVELGAVLWAATWGGDPKLRHALGLGKPFGWGQVSLSVEKVELERLRDGAAANDWASHIRAFEEHMERDAGLLAWRDSEQLVQLRALADPRCARALADAGQLQHGSIEGRNDFVEVKRAGRVLTPLVPFSGTSDLDLYAAEARAARKAAEEREWARYEQEERQRQAEARARAEEQLRALGGGEVLLELEEALTQKPMLARLNDELDEALRARGFAERLRDASVEARRRAAEMIRQEYPGKRRAERILRELGLEQP